METQKIVFVNLGQSFADDTIRDNYYHNITDYLTEQGFELEIVNGSEYDEELTVAQLKDADAVIFSSNGKMTRKVMERLPRLSLIMRYGIGLDSVDLEAAAELGKIVCNIPGYCSEMIGMHAVVLALASLRNIPYYNDYTRKGIWLKGNGPMPRLPRNLTVGFFGMGMSGGTAAKVFGRGFGSRLIAYDPYAKPALAQRLGVGMVTFEELLTQSDIVIICAPLTPETRYIFNDDAFAKMKPDAILVNISRGGIVDLAALDRALRAGRIGKAALDVFDVEPPDPKDPLFENEHLIATPHTAYYGRESLDNADYLVGRIPAFALREKKLFRSYLANPQVMEKLEGYTLSDEVLLDVMPEF